VPFLLAESTSNCLKITNLFIKLLPPPTWGKRVFRLRRALFRHKISRKFREASSEISHEISRNFAEISLWLLVDVGARFGIKK
jgi:hypothetical protein